jgi:hypothetical protein
MTRADSTNRATGSGNTSGKSDAGRTTEKVSKVNKSKTPRITRATSREKHTSTKSTTEESHDYKELSTNNLTTLQTEAVKSAVSTIKAEVTVISTTTEFVSSTSPTAMTSMNVLAPWKALVPKPIITAFLKLQPEDQPTSARHDFMISYDAPVTPTSPQPKL